MVVPKKPQRESSAGRRQVRPITKAFTFQRQARGWVVGRLPKERKKAMTNDELDLLELEELTAAIARRTNAFILVIEEKGRLVKEDTVQIDYFFEGGAATSLGLLAVARQRLLERIAAS